MNREDLIALNERLRTNPTPTDIEYARKEIQYWHMEACRFKDAYEQEREMRTFLGEAAEGDTARLYRAWDQYRCAHLLLANDHSFIGKPGGAIFFIIPGVSQEGVPLLAVNVNDVFYPAADCEEYSYEEAPELWEIARLQGWPGIIKWVKARRKARGEAHEPWRAMDDDPNTYEGLKARVQELEKHLAEKQG